MTSPRVLHGRYEVGEVIGHGATADVHRGHDIRIDRPIAIKILHTGLARNPRFQARFQREARTAAVLRHPAIVSVYDIGHEKVGPPATEQVRVPFIVMEHVPGQTLREVIRAGRITLEASLHHQLGVLAALDVIHRTGVVHGDIKPANVMITPEGNVKVVDFGMARSRALSDMTMSLTRSFLGTPSYISPEQVRGGAADARSDLYSAGCLLHELLTGRPPFVGEDPISIAYQHVHERPPQISTSTPALDGVLVKALAKAPKDRFQDAPSFIAALRSATTRIAHGSVGAHRGTGADALVAAPAMGSHAQWAGTRR